MALYKLDCNINRLTALDLSGCAALRYLECNDNQLTTLDVSGSTALEGLDCSANQLKTLAIAGCATLREQSAKDKEDLMVAAGFVPKFADTPDKKAKLDSLTPLKMHTYIQNNETMYAFADPAGCNCAYVGNQAQYAEYRRLAQQKKMAEERLQAEQWSQENPPYWGWGTIDDYNAPGFAY
jgi:hypothetical protein